MLQYEVVQMVSLANCSNKLNELASNGWRLIQIVEVNKFHYMFLERELEQTLEK